MSLETDSLGIQLTRMEGVLNNVAEKLSDVRSTVGDHTLALTRQDSRIQSLEEGQSSNKQTADALALSVKEAKTRLIAVLGTFATVAGVIIAAVSLLR